MVEKEGEGKGREKEREREEKEKQKNNFIGRELFGFWVAISFN